VVERAEGTAAFLSRLSSKTSSSSHIDEAHSSRARGVSLSTVMVEEGVEGRGALEVTGAERAEVAEAGAARGAPREAAAAVARVGARRQ